MVLCALSASAHAADAQINDPCRLLTVSEVEAVVGPLAGPPFRANGATPARRGEDCRYEVAAGRAIRVNVMWEGGAQYIGMMGAMENTLKTAGLNELKISNAVTVTGEWDRANVSQCCEFNALRGDRLVTIDVAGSQATIAQAASLAAAAVKRFDQPLDINGAAGIQAAETRAALRPKPRPVCELVSQSDAEAMLGVKLVAAPKGNQESCIYEWALPASGERTEIKLTMQWKDGFHDLRQISGMTAAATSMLGMQGLGGRTPAKAVAGPWDEYAQSFVGVMAVKDDVLASVETGPFRQDVGRAFVEKAIANLMK